MMTRKLSLEAAQTILATFHPVRLTLKLNVVSR